MREVREQEAKKKRDKVFNEVKPMISQGKRWKVKQLEPPTSSPLKELATKVETLGQADAAPGDVSTTRTPKGDVDMYEFDNDDLLDYEPTPPREE